MAALPPLHIGLSGWTYASWRTGFYQGVPRKTWLPFYATRFPAVEVNASFYHRVAPQVLLNWCEKTPAGFGFAMKANRELTHQHRLHLTAELLEQERAHIMPLGERLLAVLWQLPPGLQRNLQRLRDFLALLDGWQTTRHAIEFRHPSWFDDEVASLLGEHRIAVTQSDASRWPMWEAVTTDLVYIRLHGNPETYHSAYDDRALDSWADRITRWRAEGRSVQVYFDNTDSGHAPEDALRLMTRLGVTAPGGAPEGLL